MKNNIQGLFNRLSSIVYSRIMQPLFQLSTRKYKEEIELIKKAMMELEGICNVKNGCIISDPFNRAGWTFFNIQLSSELFSKIETSGMMENARGYRIAEQLKNFLGHFLESRGIRARIEKIDY